LWQLWESDARLQGWNRSHSTIFFFASVLDRQLLGQLLYMLDRAARNVHVKFRLGGVGRFPPSLGTPKLGRRTNPAAAVIFCDTAAVGPIYVSDEGRKAFFALPLGRSENLTKHVHQKIQPLAETENRLLKV
jgi:hypothetical protein